MNYLLPLFFLLTIFSHAQTWVNVTEEYIQNPSFEDYTSCPTSNSNYPIEMWIDSVVGWQTPTQATSDYFNVCNTTFNGIPYNYSSGYQPTYDGYGYCGFLAYSLWDDKMWSEYIQTKLKITLKPNTNYLFSMRINRANDRNFSVQNIGANFTNNHNNNFNTTSPFNIVPTVLNKTGFINDTLDWTLVSGEFKAQGNENYLTIGWFGDTITSDYQWFIPPDIDPISGDSLYLPETYYLVDSLNLYELVYDIENFNINVISPNNDGINDFIDFSIYNLSELYFEVYNRWGNKVFSSHDSNLIWNGHNNNGKLLSEGTYYYILHTTLNSGKQISKSKYITIIH